MCSAGPPLALGKRWEDIEEEEDHTERAEGAVLCLVDLGSTLIVGLLRGELLEDRRVLGLRLHLVRVRVGVEVRVRVRVRVWNDAKSDVTISPAATASASVKVS